MPLFLPRTRLASSLLILKCHVRTYRTLDLRSRQITTRCHFKKKNDPPPPPIAKPPAHTHKYFRYVFTQSALPDAASSSTSPPLVTTHCNSMRAALMGAEQTKHISRRHTEQCGTNGGTGAGTNGATVYRLDGRSSDACVNPSYILAISVVVRLLPKAFCAPAAMAVLAAAYSRKLFYRIPVTLWHFQDTSRHICPCPHRC